MSVWEEGWREQRGREEGVYGEGKKGKRGRKGVITRIRSFNLRPRFPDQIQDNLIANLAVDRMRVFFCLGKACREDGVEI